MDATAQIEDNRVKAALQDLHVTYTGAAVVGQQPKRKSNFVAIVYNELTPEQRQRFEERQRQITNMEFEGNVLNILVAEDNLINQSCL